MTKLPALLLIGSVLCFSLACQEATSDEAEAGDPGPSVEALAACVEDDFGPTPFMGPAFDPQSGALVEALPDSYIVATTAGWTRPESEHQEALGAASGEISAKVFESAGLLGVSFAGSESCGSARTLSLWVDEASLSAFVWSSVHSDAMSLVPTTTLGWETTRWVESSATPPTWDEARAALDEVRSRD